MLPPATQSCCVPSGESKNRIGCLDQTSEGTDPSVAFLFRKEETLQKRMLEAVWANYTIARSFRNSAHQVSEGKHLPGAGVNIPR